MSTDKMFYTKDMVERETSYRTALFLQRCNELGVMCHLVIPEKYATQYPVLAPYVKGEQIRLSIGSMAARNVNISTLGVEATCRFQGVEVNFVIEILDLIGIASPETGYTTLLNVTNIVATDGVALVGFVWEEDVGVTHAHPAPVKRPALSIVKS